MAGPTYPQTVATDRSTAAAGAAGAAAHRVAPEESGGSSIAVAGSGADRRRIDARRRAHANSMTGRSRHSGGAERTRQGPRRGSVDDREARRLPRGAVVEGVVGDLDLEGVQSGGQRRGVEDRKSTRLNSSHSQI